MGTPTEVQKIIYDFGANSGDDLPYYLAKAHKTIAVEANPVLATAISQRFSQEVSEGRLVVENVAVTEADTEESVAFFIHRKVHVLSTVIEPSAEARADYDRVVVPAISANNLLLKHGSPHYIKIDLEGYDIAVLRALFQRNIFPPHISVEGHDPAALGMLAGFGQYDRFKFVRGSDIGTLSSKVSFAGLDGSISEYDFPVHSAGPFGDDISGPWMSARDLFERIRIEGCGWYDIHAARGPKPLDVGIPTHVERTLKTLLIHGPGALGFMEMQKAVLRISFPRAYSVFTRIKVAAERLVRGGK